MQRVLNGDFNVGGICVNEVTGETYLVSDGVESLQPDEFDKRENGVKEFANAIFDGEQNLPAVEYIFRVILHDILT